MSTAAGPVPLLITGDQVLRDEVLRLAASVGSAVEVADSADVALSAWSSAGLVLLGADLAAAVTDAAPSRRDGVHLLGRAPAPDALFRTAVTLGAEDVLELPAAADLLAERLADEVDGGVGTALTVGVLRGSGGAGATTLACALGLVAAEHAPVLLVDLDPFGPGGDRVIGVEDAAGIRWDALRSSSGRLGSRSLRGALPRVGDLAVLAWPAAPCPRPDQASVREVLAAGARGHRLVVVDLPVPSDDLTLDTTARCDRVVLVVDPTLAGVASAGRVVGALESVRDRVSLAVRTTAHGAGPEQIAAVLGRPLLVEVPTQRRLAEHVDLGLGPVHGRRSALARAMRRLWSALDPDGAGAGRR